MIKKHNQIIFGLLLMMLGPLIWADEKSKKVGGDSKTNEESSALRITTKSLSDLVFATEYSAPASVVSLNDSNISAEIQGRAMKVAVEVGDTVKRGKLLVTLDCRSYANSRKQAVAALNLSKTQRNFAQTQYNRNKRLVQRGVLPRETFDRSESELLNSRADISLKEVAIESADLAISKCKIYAPFSGQVTNKFVQEGQLVNPGSALIQLLQTDKLEVEAELSPFELNKARNSSSLKFTAESLDITVKIRTVLQQLNKSSNTQRVRLTSKDSNSDTLIAGLNGRLAWRDGSRKIPPEYLVRREDKLGIMLNDDGKAKFHELRGAREGQPAVVNLRSSSQVIIVNRYSAEDGQAVVTQ